MPLTPKGEKIMSNMMKEYGAEKAKRIFYASRNAGKITGVDPASMGGRGPKRVGMRKKK